MAYFDSAKHRALWQEELKSLTAERELRKNGSRAENTQKSAGTGNPLVQKITFLELLAEEKHAAPSARVPKKEPGLTMSTPQKSAKSL